jgi:hypothetical protein
MHHFVRALCLLTWVRRAYWMQVGACAARHVMACISRREAVAEAMLKWPSLGYLRMYLVYLVVGLIGTWAVHYRWPGRGPRQALDCLRQPSCSATYRTDVVVECCPCRWGLVLCWRKQRQGAMRCMKLENDGDATGRQTHCIQPGSPPPHVPNFVQQTVLAPQPRQNNSMHF